MQNVLVVVPAKTPGPAAPLAAALRHAGCAVACRILDDHDAVDTLCGAFGGRPPDLILADLSAAHDCLPLRHLRRVLGQTWGDDAPAPPLLALFHPRHLALPDWPAYADDFLLPPYDTSELLARVSLLLFRKRHVRADDTVPFADIIIDLADGGVRRHGASDPLPLTPREYDLLRFFVTHRGKFFARDRLLDMVWGVGYEGGERTVDIHVRRLRAKLPPQAAACLETRRGIGYGLRVSD